MSYIEATVIVDGAVDLEDVFGDGEADKLETWLITQKELAMAHPLHRTEIFMLDHDHPPDLEDCSCAQYLTDHHPHWSWDKVGGRCENDR